MQKESEDTWISDRFDVHVSPYKPSSQRWRILEQKSGWRGLEREPESWHIPRSAPLWTSCDPPASHPSPREASLSPQTITSPSLISALSVCLRTPTNCFIYSPDCWYLTWAAESFCVPASQRNPAATFQHHHLPRVFYVSITPANNFRRSQRNVMGRCSKTRWKETRSSWEVPTYEVGIWNYTFFYIKCTFKILDLCNKSKSKNVLWSRCCMLLSYVKMTWRQQV